MLKPSDLKGCQVVITMREARIDKFSRRRWIALEHVLAQLFSQVCFLEFQAMLG